VVPKSEFDCHFAIREPSAVLQTLIKGHCLKLIELPKENTLFTEARFLCKNYLDGNEIVVLDGYHFLSGYQRVLKKTGCKVVCIDDLHHTHFAADVIVNHPGGVRTGTRRSWKLLSKRATWTFSFYPICAPKKW